MKLDEIIATIEGCGTLDELRDRLNRIVQDIGFAAFGFVDAGVRGRGDVPFHVGTAGRRWEEEYVRNGFASVDPCLAVARRTNVPFLWSEVPLPEVRGHRLPGAIKTMNAARDHGFRDGLVVPFHFRDGTGMYHSASAVFFWKDDARWLTKLLAAHRHHLHLIMLYWMQRAIDLIARDARHAASPFASVEAQNEVGLTDREREVLTWAARGLTMRATGAKLNLADDTIETHMRNATRKLGARNKTHATSLAVHRGLVEP
jgi:DNA-binding CsgD family transcriptional regulator